MWGFSVLVSGMLLATGFAGEGSGKCGRNGMVSLQRPNTKRLQISLPSASTVQLGDWLFAGGLGIRFSLALGVPARLFGRA